MARFRFTVCLAAAVAAAGFSDLASAGGSSGGSWGGSSGGYGSSGGSSGGYAALYASASSGGSYGSSGGYASSGGAAVGHMGPLRRLAARFRAHHARRAALGSSGGASSGGSSGGSSGYVTYRSLGSSGGSSGASSGGSSGGTLGYSASAARYAVPLAGYRGSAASRSAIAGYESSEIDSSYQRYTPLNDSAAGSTAAAESSPAASEAEDRYAAGKPALDDDAALLTVAVPSESAKVTVNGHATASEGVVRQFMSRGLKEGFLYTYVVKVTYDQDGEAKTESREVKLRPGDMERVVFGSPADASPMAEDLTATEPESESARSDESTVTVVKLHVPADATVTLAGNPTKGNGTIRAFRTTQLKPGERWSDYTVRVTTEVNGQRVSRERTISVEAGSNNELTFEFDQAAVAKN